MSDEPAILAGDHYAKTGGAERFPSTVEHGPIEVPAGVLLVQVRLRWFFDPLERAMSAHVGWQPEPKETIVLEISQSDL